MSGQSLQGQLDALERSIGRASPGEVPKLRQRLTQILRGLKTPDPALSRKATYFRRSNVVEADEDIFDNMPV